ncbi:MAG: 4-hydroxyphenylpyruvate dioxygenase [uncultured Sphingomonas sp.]|uniref:4-hydroxyphenylpyruvate dioxygenase n=1 Tax=uncultured Sphingomonas sp. TaxID=158754 RepID=A0A6J4TE97_9SPHN|nr:MAG: 4-hydroxyphenylpyruvate dioxygenase [uncultured Sphingomonas sp.]
MATATAELTPLGLENPMGTDGFEFVEYAAPDPELLRSLFAKLGFPAIARHRQQDITLHRQGDINFLINAHDESHAADFASEHGPSAVAMAFRVKDASAAHARALELGATDMSARGLGWPAIEGIGGSLLYLVDRYGVNGSAYGDDQWDFEPDAEARMEQAHSHLVYLDHLTHNVHRGRMAHWADFYERLFNFREIRYFDIEGKVTGLFSKAMTSPDGKIRIPLNESQDDKSQIEEFLREYGGEGIQHIALGSTDIYASVDILSVRGIPFQDTPETYYDLLDERVKDHGEPLGELKKRRILVDGAPTEGQGLLLQIFTQNVIGPIFYEIIQRKGNEGFGEGNFKALFESIELDQIRRGVISAE